MILKYSQLLLLITAFALFAAACSSSTSSVPPPDLSTVPDPFEIGDTEPVELANGLTIYDIDEGSGEFEVVIRDVVTLMVTLRTLDGEIIYSTFANGNTTGSSGGVNDIRLTPTFSFSLSKSFTDGFRNGILGMKEDGVRVIIVPPALGFANAQSGTNTAQYRNDTLRYDVTLLEIQN